jgi:hypothetical protein
MRFIDQRDVGTVHVERAVEQLAGPHRLIQAAGRGGIGLDFEGVDKALQKERQGAGFKAHRAHERPALIIDLGASTAVQNRFVTGNGIGKVGGQAAAVQTHGPANPRGQPGLESLEGFDQLVHEDADSIPRKAKADVLAVFLAQG